MPILSIDLIFLSALLAGATAGDSSADSSVVSSTSLTLLLFFLLALSLILFNILSKWESGFFKFDLTFSILFFISWLKCLSFFFFKGASVSAASELYSVDDPAFDGCLMVSSSTGGASSIASAPGFTLGNLRCFFLTVLVFLFSIYSSLVSAEFSLSSLSGISVGTYLSLIFLRFTLIVWSSGIESEVSGSVYAASNTPSINSSLSSLLMPSTFYYTSLMPAVRPAARLLKLNSIYFFIFIKSLKFFLFCFFVLVFAYIAKLLTNCTIDAVMSFAYVLAFVILSPVPIFNRFYVFDN